MTYTVNHHTVTSRSRSGRSQRTGRHAHGRARVALSKHVHGILVAASGPTTPTATSGGGVATARWCGMHSGSLVPACSRPSLQQRHQLRYYTRDALDPSCTEWEAVQSVSVGQSGSSSAHVFPGRSQSRRGSCYPGEVHAIQRLCARVPESEG